MNAIDRRLFALAAIAVIAAAVVRGQEPDRSRVTPEGPYRSKMRIVTDAGAPAPELDAQSALAAAGDDPYARALVQRNLAYLAAADGDTAAAIERLREALAGGALAPVAQAQMRADLLRLLATDNQDSALADAYRQWRAQGHDFGASGHLSAARALARLERFDAALEALRLAIALRPQPPPGWREFEVFVLTQLTRYAEAARVQAQRLEVTSASRDDWRNLIGLLMAAQDRRGAVAAMELAVENAVLDRPSDTETLARLYLQTGLPDHAAHLLQHQLDAGVLSGTPEHQRLLARAYLLAGDDVAAVAPLKALADRDSVGTDSYRLGQVLLRIGRAAEAVDSLRRALRGDLGPDLGRAWLLLGEAHLQTGNVAAARRAWTRAAQIGGSYRQAQTLLERLAQSEPPSAVPPTAATDTGIAAAPPVPPAPARMAPLPRKKVPRQRFFYIAERVRVDDLPARTRRLTRLLRNAVRRERLTVSGPLQFIATGAGSGAFELQVGVPVRSRVPPRGKFRNRDTQPFDCVYRQFRGPASDLAQVWDAFARDTAEAGLTPNGETRTVILDYSPGDGRHLFELQVGVALPLSSPGL